MVVDGATSDTQIGGPTTDLANRITGTFGLGVGVWVADGTGTEILVNSISGNDGLGIDLGTFGVNPNDAGDGDNGANRLQNSPVLTSVDVSGASTTVHGHINTTPSKTVTLRFFSNQFADGSGYGEGETFLGEATVTTDGSGNASFAPSFPVAVGKGIAIAATATVPEAFGGKNTSEFSNVVTVPTVEFRVNTGTAGEQSQTMVGIDAAGNSLVVWWSYDSATPGLYFRRFDASGTPIDASDRLLSSFGNVSLALAVATDGSFVVTCAGFFSATSYQMGLYAQRFGPDGTAHDTAPFLVSTQATDFVEDAVAGFDAAGNFVLAWAAGTEFAEPYTEVYVRRYSASGTPRDAAEVRVNAATAGTQDSPSLAVGPGGDFVVAWRSTNNITSATSIVARRFTATGAPSPQSSRCRKRQTPGRTAIAMAADGRLTAIWFTPTGLRARRFNAANAPLDAQDIVVSSSSTDYWYAVVGQADGGFVAVWHDSDGPNGTDVLYRPFSSAGIALRPRPWHTTSSPATSGIPRRRSMPGAILSSPGAAAGRATPTESLRVTSPCPSSRSPERRSPRGTRERRRPRSPSRSHGRRSCP